MIIKTLKTSQISAQIEKLAKDEQLDSSTLFFKLHKSDTYIKTIKEPEYVLYNDDTHGYLSDSKKMIDEHVEFKQLHTIAIQKTNPSSIKLEYKLDISTTKTSASIILLPSSELPYDKFSARELYRALILELNQIKAQNKILVNLFDDEMIKNLKIFIKHLYGGKFTKPLKLPLIKTLESESGANGGLELFFLEKKQEDMELIEVDANEVLAIYEKPTAGRNGLDIFGSIITSDSAIHKKDITSEVDERSIEIVEKDNQKIYKSRLKGFVVLDEKSFYVDNKVKLQTISRLQKQLAKAESNSIEVIVAQDDTNLDSVGDGVELVSYKVHINGHIGAKSTIKANELIIEGATHKESYQEAKYANINRHKGLLRCHEATINLLEGGVVYATNITINDSLGGAVYGENVTIKRVKHNLKVFASNSITIKSISGENNTFKINYRDIPTLLSKVTFLKQELDEHREKLQDAKRNNPQDEPKLNQEINELKKNIELISQSSLSAKVDIQGNIDGINNIIFILPNNEELNYKTTLRNYKPFHIDIKGDYATLSPTTKKVKLK
ncbi:MAG: flagellar assembly protein A [Sulfurimonas sp.]